MTLEDAQAIRQFMVIPNDKKDFTSFDAMSDDEFVSWMFVAERTRLELVQGWYFIAGYPGRIKIELCRKIQGQPCYRIVDAIMEMRRLCPEPW